MSSARRVDWSLPPSQRSVAKKPSWLVSANVPAPAPPSSKRPNLQLISVVPGPPARITIPPEPPAPVSEPQPYQRMLEDRDEQITVLTGELENLKAMAGTLAAQLATVRRRTLEASESELVKLAIAIASRVVGEQVEKDPAILAKWAKEAIAMLPAKQEIVVAVSPDLAECVPEAAWPMAGHRLEIDKNLPKNTCEVREGATSVVVNAEERMAAIGEAIS